MKFKKVSQEWNAKISLELSYFSSVNRMVDYDGNRGKVSEYWAVKIKSGSVRKALLCRNIYTHMQVCTVSWYGFSFNFGRRGLATVSCTKKEESFDWPHQFDNLLAVSPNRSETKCYFNPVSKDHGLQIIFCMWIDYCRRKTKGMIWSRITIDENIGFIWITIV